MNNEKLQSILANYPDECEILIMKNDYEAPSQVCAEYYSDDDFTVPKIIIYV